MDLVMAQFMNSDSESISQCSVFRTNRFVFVKINHNVLKDWTVDSITKRVIAFAALILLVVGSIPLMTTSVHGQPRTQLEFEVQTLRAQVEKLNSVPTDIALIVAHQKLEDERYKEQMEFQSKLVWGFFGTGGGLLMMALGWLLHQFGITIGTATNGLPVNGGTIHSKRKSTST